MQLRDKNILIISPEPWDHVHVSKHHYAKHLAERGNRVFFLNPPKSDYNVSPTEIESLKVLDYPPFIKGLRHFPSFISKRLIVRKFLKLQEIAQTQFDIVWSFDNSVFFDFSEFSERILKISHIVDLNMDFEWKRAASTSDVCFCTTELIKARLETANQKTYKINHGLNVSSVETTRQLKSKRVNALYLGNLAMRYIDWEILYSIASDDTSDLFFVGPNSDKIDITINETHGWKSKLKALTNTHFLDPVQSDEIQSLIAQCDILLIAYQEKHFQDQANPHKVLEYLYSGKPIVATYTSEYSGSDLLYMSKSNSEWPDLFRRIATNIEQHSNSELSKKRKNFALSNSYNKQIDRIEKLLPSQQS
jgi:glycosyltransferase involved in cell wall biosynthesis